MASACMYAFRLVACMHQMYYTILISFALILALYAHATNRHSRYCFYLSLTGLLTAIRGLNICSHLYLRVLSPPGPCQALTINYNNQTIWILKLSLFLTIQLVPIPRPPTAYKALDTSVLAQKGYPQTLHAP